MNRPPLDRDAIRRGVTVAAVCAIPALVVSWLSDNGSGKQSLAAHVTIVVLVGLVLGAFAAARQQRAQAPLTHALVTVMGVVIVLQLLRIARLAVLKRPLNLPVSLGNLLLGLLAAVVGGMLAGQNPAKRGPAN
jgi:cell division protein FtsW (lipid II flippase)